MAITGRRPVGEGVTRAARRSELVEKLGQALERLATQGESFSDVTVERLVGEAGVSRSSFYRYFEDRGDVLVAIAGRLFEERDASGRAIWQVPPDAPRTALEAAFTVFLRVCWRHRAVMRAMAEAQVYNAAVRELSHAVFRDAVTHVAEHIRIGQSGGWVRAELDPDPIAEWLVAMNDRGLTALVATADESAVERLARSVSAVVWFTLYEGVRPQA